MRNLWTAISALVAATLFGPALAYAQTAPAPSAAGSVPPSSQAPNPAAPSATVPAPAPVLPAPPAVPAEPQAPAQPVPAQPAPPPAADATPPAADATLPAPPAAEAPPANAAPPSVTLKPSVAEAPLKPATAPSTETEEPVLSEDTLAEPGYVPGYRRHLDLGLSPYAPRIGTRPGGMTSAFGSKAPTPPGGWTFTWTGYMSASLQFSVDERPNPQDGQATTTYHAPPLTVDEYWNFTGTNTVPGSWIHMNFAYGNEAVTANVQITTFNPTRPTTYYALGSQNFINNAFLTFRAPPVAGIRLRWNFGYFSNAYGNLSRYGNGMYTNSITGGPRGVGETMTAEYSLSESNTLVFEHGLMADRNAKVPDDVIPTPVNGYQNPLWPASFVHHAHLGLNHKADAEYQFQIHYLSNFAQDDRIEREVDNRGTDEIDETNIKDGYIHVYSADARAISGVWGTFGIGAALIDAKDSFPLKALNSYAGDGEKLTQRFLGDASLGTGKMYVAGFNYALSLGTLLSHPVPFTPGPDILLQTGLHILTVDSPVPEFDGRVRHKYGVDALYLLFKHFGAGVRFDRVVPNSKDGAETFHVLAPVLQFKSDWASRDTLTLKYAKWFYGSRTRRDDGSAATELDDQLVALNFNMWW